MHRKPAQLGGRFQRCVESAAGGKHSRQDEHRQVDESNNNSRHENALPSVLHMDPILFATALETESELATR